MEGKLLIAPIDETSVRALAGWRYEPPYDYYNHTGGEKEIAEFVASYLDPANPACMILDADGELVGFCSFGTDGQVPGGDYSAHALDVGMGMRPDLTGKGHGRLFAMAVVDYAEQRFNALALRVTIAAFNERAIVVWRRLGFQKVSEFVSAADGVPFIIMLRHGM